MAHYTDWPEYPTDLLDLVDYPTQTDDVDYVQAWLINALANEMIAVQKELGTLPKGASADVKTRLDTLGGGYTDRGDPSSFDFTLANFTTDATWRELDLSSIIPTGTTLVHFYFEFRDNTTGKYFQLRKNGNTNTINRSGLTTQVANLFLGADFLVAADSNRKIQYRGSNTTFSNINLMVKGWWK